MERHIVRIFLIMFLILISSSGFAISAVVDSLGQRTDGSDLIDVWFTLDDLGGECLNVTIEAATESGETLTCETFIAPSDTGEICIVGNYHIIWDLSVDEPYREFFNDKIQIKLQAARPGVDPGDCGCPPSVFDYEGNEYNTVEIGDQCWMVENLKTTFYVDGTPIDNITNAIEWDDLEATESGAYAVYNNDTTLVSTYGFLYNWYAVADSLHGGICPYGWHVPTDDDWKELERYLGMSELEANRWRDYRGTNEGSKLAGRADLWTDDDLEADPEFGSSGIDILPGGVRGTGGGFFYINDYAYYWTSTEYESDKAMWRHLRYYSTEVYRGDEYRRYGLSVRCLRD